ncbi:MAG: YciI family protein [Brachybacterium sp.]|nr:YciI family protein [Brachybacterium sp.]
MPTFAVTYVYTDDPARRDQHRPRHREYLRGLHERGALHLSGPLADGPAGALLVMEAGDPEQVAELLDEDPFALEGLITERSIRPWDIVIGELPER